MSRDFRGDCVINEHVHWSNGANFTVLLCDYLVLGMNDNLALWTGTKEHEQRARRCESVRKVVVAVRRKVVQDSDPFFAGTQLFTRPARTEM